MSLSTSKNRETELIAMLMELPAVPGTFGHALQHPNVTEAEKQRQAEKKRQSELEKHIAKFNRWRGLPSVRKAFGPEHPIYADIVMWEMHTCRINQCRDWFEALDQWDRIGFCDWCRRHRE